MTTNRTSAELQGISGDIRKLIRDIEQVTKVVILLPERIDKIPGLSYREFQDASKVFDKTNAIRDEILRDFKALVPLVKDVFTISEHFIEGYELWEKTPGAVKAFRQQVKTFFSDIYKIPDGLKKVDLDHFIGENVGADALIDLSEMGLPITEDIINELLELIPDAIYYLLYLAVKAHPSWHTWPNQMNANLDHLIKLQSSDSATNGGVIASIVLGGVGYLATIVVTIIDATLDSVSRDKVVSADIIGEGFGVTLGPNPIRPVYIGFRTFFDIIAKTLNFTAIATRTVTD